MDYFETFLVTVILTEQIVVTTYESIYIFTKKICFTTVNTIFPHHGALVLLLSFCLRTVYCSFTQDLRSKVNSLFFFDLFQFG